MVHPKDTFAQQSEKEGEVRIILPKGKQVLGIVELRLGYGKSRVRCADGKTRLCRVPGARRRYLWVRPNSIVLVKPWDIQGDEKGDIIYKYEQNQVDILKKRNLLKDLSEEEF